jgi:hypothetical protein
MFWHTCTCKLNSIWCRKEYFILKIDLVLSKTFNRIEEWFQSFNKAWSSIDSYVCLDWGTRLDKVYVLKFWTLKGLRWEWQDISNVINNNMNQMKWEHFHYFWWIQDISNVISNMRTLQLIW